MRCPPQKVIRACQRADQWQYALAVFLTCQRGALWLTGHGLRVPGGCRPCNPRKARNGWVDVSELTRNRVQRYAKMAGERERERETFLRVRQSFLVSLGRKTLELTIDACVKPGLWSVAIELMERMQDESVHTRDLADPICSLIPQLLGRLVYVPCRGNQMDPNGLMVD